MRDSKTIKTIQNYYQLVNQDFNELNNDKQFFCINMKIYFAKSILQEFGDTSAKKDRKNIIECM